MQAFALCLALISSAAAEPAPAEAVAESPAVSAQAAPAGFSGWHAAGIWGGASLGASFGALPYALAASLSTVRNGGSSSSCAGGVCAIGAFTGMAVGMIAGGVLGCFLGGIARDGSLAAKLLIIATDVLGLPITGISFFIVAAASNNLPVGGG